MSADVVERVHAAVSRSRDDDAVAGHVAEHELTRARDLLRPAGADPHRPEERVELPAEVLRIGVEPAREACGRPPA